MKSPELQRLTLGQRELISDVRSVHKSRLKKVSFPRFAISLIHSSVWKHQHLSIYSSACAKT